LVCPDIGNLLFGTIYFGPSPTFRMRGEDIKIILYPYFPS
jgi:hypothetical protein